MRAKVVTIGDELLIGQTIDTNSAWIGNQLNLIGIKLVEVLSISDEKQAILNALEKVRSNTDIVLITGGLGPTKDDITKYALCEFFNTELEVVPEIAQRIEAFFKARGREMLESNYLQAALPKSCTPLDNPLGTASGMWFEKESTIYVSMPGVPYEMKGLMKNQVIPKIKSIFQLPVIHHKTIMTEGIGESFLVELIKDWESSLSSSDIKIAYLPSPGVVRIRLSAFGSDRNQMEESINRKVKELEDIIPSYIFGYDDESMESVVGRLMLKHKVSISTAESCTGGYIAHKLTSIPGSSTYYKGSILSYANEVKVQELNVQTSDLEKYGAVSQVVVEQMAKEVRTKMNTDYALATSGIAGPDGGTGDKPVGTVWIALAWEGGVYSKKYLFEKNRDRNIHRSALAAMSILRRKLDGILD